MSPDNPENGSRAEAREGIAPKYRRSFGCVTWIYMATLAFLAVISLLMMPFWFFGDWNVFSLLEGPAFAAILLFIPAIVGGAVLGARTYRSGRRVATRNGAAIGTVIGWLGYAFVVWMEVDRSGTSALGYVYPVAAAVSAVMILYALFSGDRRRGRLLVGLSALLALAGGGVVLALDGSGIVLIGALASAIAGAAAGWTAGFGYARAGGEEMLPPGVVLKKRPERRARRGRD